MSDRLADLERVQREFATFIPFNRRMALQLVSFGDGLAVLRLPWQDAFVGDPDTGVVHGGAVTALLDAACGAAVFMALPAAEGTATLDLRIDYLRAAEPGADLLARATATRRTRHVVFVGATAWTADESVPVATATATFMRGTPMGPKPGRT
jgi:uncharacterized protein (TIGR00369 family)